MYPAVVSLTCFSCSCRFALNFVVNFLSQYLHGTTGSSFFLHVSVELHLLSCDNNVSFLDNVFPQLQHRIICSCVLWTFCMCCLRYILPWKSPYTKAVLSLGVHVSHVTHKSAVIRKKIITMITLGFFVIFRILFSFCSNIFDSDFMSFSFSPLVFNFSSFT